MKGETKTKGIILTPGEIIKHGKTAVLFDNRRLKQIERGIWQYVEEVTMNGVKVHNKKHYRLFEIEKEIRELRNHAGHPIAIRHNKNLDLVSTGKGNIYRPYFKKKLKT